MTLTKDDLVNSLYENLDIPKSKATSIIEALLNNIKGKLENKEDVLISGFGKFCVKEKKDRRGRNPSTGEDLTLDARRVVVFKCSGVLRETVNGAERNDVAER
ncbi:MAG: integration host factor subunit alpha [Desulfatiglans sp.]|jgi:integration host factor subunit alpha|nr:integration host factor subunit alpha [Desulfatiglans sp.]